jgi:hypothetical protein
MEITEGGVMNLPETYTVTKLLSRLDGAISRNKLYEELETGRLVGVKIGSKWLIPEPNVLSWLGLQTEESPPGGTGDDPDSDSMIHLPTAKQGGAS